MDFMVSRTLRRAALLLLVVGVALVAWGLVARSRRGEEWADALAYDAGMGIALASVIGLLLQAWQSRLEAQEETAREERRRAEEQARDDARRGRERLKELEARLRDLSASMDLTLAETSISTSIGQLHSELSELFEHVVAVRRKVDADYLAPEVDKILGALRAEARARGTAEETLLDPEPRATPPTPDVDE